MLVSNSKSKGTALILVIAIATTLIIKLLNVQLVQADDFDLKAALLKHREQHTNHLNVSFCSCIRTFLLSDFSTNSFMVH